MIENIRQVDDGYYICTDKEEIYIDYIEIHDIIAYDNERIVGYNDDGKLAIMNATTHECETLTNLKLITSVILLHFVVIKSAGTNVQIQTKNTIMLRCSTTLANVLNLTTFLI